MGVAEMLGLGMEERSAAPALAAVETGAGLLRSPMLEETSPPGAAGLGRPWACIVLWDGRVSSGSHGVAADYEQHSSLLS